MLSFLPNKRGVLQLLCIGAHSDDLEIGCGGTVLELLQRLRIAVTWIVLSATDKRGREARASARSFLSHASQSRVLVEEFRDGYFPSQYGQIKDFFEKLKGEIAPDLVLTHAGGDLHQDHRLVSELTWNTFRDHLILEYEIVKYDGGLGSPSVFVPLSSASHQRKVRLLLRAFGTQRSKPWFTPETFNGIMRIRGVECNAPSGYAEAFYARKILI
jgi:LmbE family N-acetylglucosaminyl deacetylase